MSGESAQNATINRVNDCEVKFSRDCRASDLTYILAEIQDIGDCSSHVARYLCTSYARVYGRFLTQLAKLQQFFMMVWCRRSTTSDPQGIGRKCGVPVSRREGAQKIVNGLLGLVFASLEVNINRRF